MTTESNKRKLQIFFGGLVIIAFTINGIFSSLRYSEPIPALAPSQPKAAPATPSQLPSNPQLETERVESKSAALRAEAEAEAEATARKAREEAVQIAREEAARKATQEAAAEKAREEAAIKHAKFLERYLNTSFSRKPSIKSFAIVVASEDGRLNGTVTTALAQHFRDDSVEMISSFFKPEFITDKLFAEVFNGSTEVLKKLDVAKSLDAVLLSRQTVEYSTSPNLLNLVTAKMQLEVQVLPVTGSIHGGTWTFTANGSGFKQGEARSMAEERLIKQITNDTKMSLK